VDTPEPGTVLLVDDDWLFLLSLRESLLQRVPGRRVLMARDGLEALDIVTSTAVQLVLTDLKMPGMDGIELLASLNRDHPSVQTMVMTALAAPPLERDLRTLGALECFEKPVDLEAVTAAVARSLPAG
jgi:CheY-like chemotaxis protein